MKFIITGDLEKESRIIISNPSELELKLKKIKKESVEQLHIVADYDRTLTKAFVQGIRSNTTFGYIENHPLLPDIYRAETKRLYEHYHALELSLTLEKKEKTRLMEEWAKTVLNLMIEYKMNKIVLNDIIEKKQIVMREGSNHFFNFINNYKIPTLIFSAGIGNLIEAYLQTEQYLQKEESKTKNINIIANRIIFNENDYMIGYKEPIISSMNKTEALIKTTDYGAEIRKRKNVILLGDLLSDAEMCNGFDHETIIKIGFLNGKVETLTPLFKQAYDVIITNDGRMNYVNHLLYRITKK